ncbi:MAG: TraR/DksA family transcriptional regulator [bacterium]
MELDSRIYQKLLLQQKLEISDALNVPVKSSDTVILDQSCTGRLSRMDAMQQQAMAIALEQRQPLQLRKIEEALLRIQQKEYGLCLRCQEPISSGRLNFDPTVTLCIECASQTS